MPDSSINRYSFVANLEELNVIVTDMTIRKCKINRCINDVFQENSVVKRGQLSLFNFFGLFTDILRVGITCTSVLACIYLFIISHTNIQKFIMRNAQNYIYPIMRALRVWTLPLLLRHSTLSDFHEEECLVKNPLFHDHNLDCWPCENMRTLVDLTGHNNFSNVYVYNEQPFIVRDSLKNSFSFHDLQKLYKKYSTVLDRGTVKFLCSEIDSCFPKDILTPHLKSTSFQVMWKMNQVAAAHIFRKVFHRPYFIPNNSEVSLERFLYISGAEAPQFYLPLTDFANVWVAQGHGYRLIALDPSQQCISNCSTLSVLLRPQDVLYYNWQFWRPRSMPVGLSEDTSITYIGSFY